MKNNKYFSTCLKINHPSRATLAGDLRTQARKKEETKTRNIVALFSDALWLLGVENCDIFELNKFINRPCELILNSRANLCCQVITILLDWFWHLWSSSKMKITFLFNSIWNSVVDIFYIIAFLLSQHCQQIIPILSSYRQKFATSQLFNRFSLNIAIDNCSLNKWF